jgi:chaperonin GroES
MTVYNQTIDGETLAMATATATKKKIKFRPMDDRLLVEPCVAEEKTAGGIVLPDSAREKPQRGIVVSVGPGKLLDSGKRGELSVKIGDEVFYGKYSGTEIDMNSDHYVIIRENDILAIVDK